MIIHPIWYKGDSDVVIVKGYVCMMVCIEVFCATDEVAKLWDVEHELIEESYIDAAE
jgi:hypothetical protein